MYINYVSNEKQIIYQALLQTKQHYGNTASTWYLPVLIRDFRPKQKVLICVLELLHLPILPLRLIPLFCILFWLNCSPCTLETL